MPSCHLVSSKNRYLPEHSPRLLPVSLLTVLYYCISYLYSPTTSPRWQTFLGPKVKVICRDHPAVALVLLTTLTLSGQTSSALCLGSPSTTVIGGHFTMIKPLVPRSPGIGTAMLSNKYLVLTTPL